MDLRPLPPRLISSRVISQSPLVSMTHSQALSSLSYSQTPMTYTQAPLVYASPLAHSQISEYQNSRRSLYFSPRTRVIDHGIVSSRQVNGGESYFHQTSQSSLNVARSFARESKSFTSGRASTVRVEAEVNLAPQVVDRVVERVVPVEIEKVVHRTLPGPKEVVYVDRNVEKSSYSVQQIEQINRSLSESETSIQSTLKILEAERVSNAKLAEELARLRATPTPSSSLRATAESVRKLQEEKRMLLEEVARLGAENTKLKANSSSEISLFEQQKMALELRLVSLREKLRFLEESRREQASFNFIKRTQIEQAELDRRESERLSLEQEIFKLEIHIQEATSKLEEIKLKYEQAKELKVKLGLRLVAGLSELEVRKSKRLRPKLSA